MDDKIEEQFEPPKGLWKRIGSVVSSPVTAASKMTKESPATVLIAILLVVQPIVQTTIDLVKGLMEVRQDLSPDSRPVTKAELDIINSKIDFLQKLVLADTAADHERLERQDAWMDRKKTDPHPVAAPLPPPVAPLVTTSPPVTTYDSLNQKLKAVEKKADEQFKLRSKK